MLMAKAGAPRAERSQVRIVLGSERVSPIRTKQFDAIMARNERFWRGVMGWILKDKVGRIKDKGL